MSLSERLNISRDSDDEDLARDPQRWAETAESVVPTQLNCEEHKIASWPSWRRQLGFGFAITLFLTVGWVEPASAQLFAQVSGFLQSVVEVVTGDIAFWCAVLALAVGGILLFFQQIGMRFFFGIVFGCGIIWGAEEIVSAIRGS